MRNKTALKVFLWLLLTAGAYSLWHYSIPVIRYIRDPYAWTQPSEAKLFAFVSEKIRNIPEPFGSDHWQSPQETLQLRSGDCEDKALILGDLFLYHYSIDLPIAIIQPIGSDECHITPCYSAQDGSLWAMDPTWNGTYALSAHPVIGIWPYTQFRAWRLSK